MGGQEEEEEGKEGILVKGTINTKSLTRNKTCYSLSKDIINIQNVK